MPSPLSSTLRAPAGGERRTEERILEAATLLFYEKGYHGTSMREVAAAVGIKAASLYNHFPGKEDLLFRIAYGTMAELLEGGLAAIAPYETARERLRALVVWHVVYHAERRFEARVADEQLHALGPERRSEAVRIRDEYTGLFKDILRAGRADDGWTVPSTSVVTFGIGGMCTFVDTWYREDGPLSAAEIAEMYADLVLRALESGGHDSSRSLAGS
jgi:AcrR family transcriptional regulator